ncbi:MAG: MBL fold metallo-hydrolase [Alphaproteobacteria bacterium]|nr:MBL fold metallo-hydrolase [Alphaproteobacteria bacterium]
MSFNLEIIRMSPSNTNSVLVAAGADAVIFDPWGSAADWKKLFAERGLNLAAIYLTHGHYDHMSAIPKLNAEWFMHHADMPIIKWQNPVLFVHGYGTLDAKKNPPRDIAPGEIEILPGLKCEVIHTPGHSAGSVCFYIKTPLQSTPHASRLMPYVLISGDTLFFNTIGRTDLPGSSDAAMDASLAALAARGFPDDTFVIPGHGPAGAFSDVKIENKFLFRKMKI